jgi:hypothetical protein
MEFAGRRDRYTYRVCRGTGAGKLFRDNPGEHGAQEPLDTVEAEIPKVAFPSNAPTTPLAGPRFSPREPSAGRPGRADVVTRAETGCARRQALLGLGGAEEGTDVTRRARPSCRGPRGGSPPHDFGDWVERANISETDRLRQKKF